MHSLVCDSKILLVGICLGNLSLEHLQCIQYYANRQLHNQKTTIPLIVMKTRTLQSKATVTLRVTLQFSNIAYKIHKKFQGKAISFVKSFIQKSQYHLNMIYLQDND